MAHHRGFGLLPLRPRREHLRPLHLLRRNAQRCRFPDHRGRPRLFLDHDRPGAGAVRSPGGPCPAGLHRDRPSAEQSIQLQVGVQIPGRDHLFRLYRGADLLQPRDAPRPQDRLRAAHLHHRFLAARRESRRRGPQLSAAQEHHLFGFDPPETRPELPVVADRRPELPRAADQPPAL